jgi:hypothetical protein
VPEINQPGAPALLYRYQPGDKFVSQPLSQDGNGFWTTRMLPDQVGTSGFWYKLRAGDAETPVYQVSVRAQPFVQRYDITYHHRPYLNLPPTTVTFPNQHAALPSIQGRRGTEVTFVAHTNRALRQASVLVATGKTRRELPAQVLKGDPRAFRCRWVLEQSGEFFVAFTSVEGETYSSRVPFPIDVTPDRTPVVTLTRPAQHVELPANGTLDVEGVAEDDLGIKDLTLRLQLIEGGKPVPLRPQPYRPEVSLDLDGKGDFPLRVDYLDLVKVDELKTPDGEMVTLQPGALIEYWLEATDNCDYPNKTGNVGKSPSYRIKILPPMDEQKQQQARDQAQKKQQSHHKRQDQKLAQEKHQKAEKNAAQQGNDGAGGNSADKQRAEELQNNIQNELDKHKQQDSQPDKGQAKGNEPQQADHKPGQSDGADAPSPQPKNEPPGNPNETGNTKDAPQPAGADSKPGESKDAGPPNESKGSESGGGSSPQADPMKGASKDAPKDGSGSERSDGPQAGGPEQPAQGKENGPDPKAPEQSPQAKGAGEGQQAPSAQSKPGNEAAKTEPSSGPPPQGTAKGQETNAPASTSKGPPPDTKSADAHAKGPGDKSGSEAPGMAKGETKPPPADPKEGPGLARGDAPSASDGKPREPTPQDVEHLKELMQRKDGIGDLAAKALTEMSKEAPDPKVRELAKEALDQAGPKTIPGEGNSGPGDPKSVSGKAPPDGPTGNPNQGTPGTKANPGNETKIGQGPTQKPSGTDNETKGVTGQRPGQSSGSGDVGKADKARKDLSRFGGNLQLEDFIKRATPEYRAKAGISDEQWQRLLAQAAEYDALLRKTQQPKGKGPRDARGTAGGPLDSSGPTHVQGAHGVGEPAESGQAETPPELRDAQQRFTTKGPP